MRSFVVLGVCLFAIAVTAVSGRAQIIAGEDFDTGGLSAVTSAYFEGDFDSGTFAAHDNTFNGLFDFGTGSRFDRFGTVNPTVMDDASFIGSQEGLPFDMVDDSTNGFDIDRLGVLLGGVDNAALGLADTLNGSNIDGDGKVSAEWTFDISSGSNMQLSVDLAAIGAFDNNDGGFETDDFLTLTYQIDGGPVQTAFDVRPENSPGGPVTNEFYTVTMAGGVEYDRYFIPTAFFSTTAWDNLTTNGPDPGTSLDYHPLDTNEDGFVELEGAFGVESTRALSSGGFDNTELEVFKNPLIVNGTTRLNNQFQTVSVPVVGSGSTLTLKLLAVADGSLEYSFLDNIVIEEVSGTPGDFDGDGDVDGADFLEWQRTDGTPGGLAEWEGAYPGGGSLGAVASVPEPNTIGLVSLAMVSFGAFSNRRRS